MCVIMIRARRERGRKWPKKYFKKKVKKGLDILSLVCYIEATQELQGEAKAPTKGSEDVDEMTAPELNAFLENLARLIEASAKTPEDAARLVRESKIKA